MLFRSFWSRDQDYIQLGANTWNSFQWTSKAYQDYIGTVFVSGGGVEADPGKHGTGEDLIAGVGKVNGLRYGRVHVAPSPGVLSFATEALAQGGVGERRALITKGVRDAYGDVYATIKALELHYESRTCSVSCPCVRTDIGPLTALAIRFPNIPEILSATGTTTLGVYGTVQAVTISIDATSGFAQTTYDVGYVRSLQQQRDLERMDLLHPFFDTNYLGARLDGDPFESGFAD